MAKKNTAKEEANVQEEPKVVNPEGENETQAPDNQAAEEDNTVEVHIEGSNGKEQDQSEGGQEGGEVTEEPDELALLKAEVEKARQEVVELKDKNLRLRAEFDNFRRRTRKEALDFREYASEEMITALLPFIDDFGRTMGAMEKTDKLSSLKEGITLVNGKLWNILEKKGVKILDPMGEEFNLDYHEAIHSIPVEEEEKKGKVLDVVEKGYQLKDKVIRYAKVVIGE